MALANGLCIVKNHFQEPQAGWSFILPDGSALPMIIDSGASFAFLSRGAWEKTRKLLKEVDVNVRNTAQVRNRILGYVEDVTLKHPPDNIHFDKLLVCDGPEIALYLNFITLNQLGATIDFATGVLDINLHRKTSAIATIPNEPQMPMRMADEFNVQRQNELIIEENLTTIKRKVKSRSKTPPSKDRDRKRCRNLEERGRSIKKNQQCFKCKKMGHIANNCPDQSVKLKVGTRFAGGKNGPEKFDRKPQFISANKNVNQDKNQNSLRNQQQGTKQNNTLNRDNNSRHDTNKTKDNANNSQRPANQQTRKNSASFRGESVAEKSHSNNPRPDMLLRNPNMNSMPINQSNLQNQYPVFSYNHQPFATMMPNSFALNQQQNFMPNQVPQTRMSTFNNPMFGQGFNRFM